MSAPRWIAWVLLLLGAARAAAAQEQQALVPLPVTVTWVAGPILTLDAGSDAGLALGDRARVTGAAGRVYSGQVVLVGARSARVELEGDDVVEGVAVGARAEVLVPAARARRRGQDEPVADGPEHPGWTEPLEDWDPSQPLLAPAKSPQPEERPTDWRGRAWTRFEWTDDQVGGDRQYLRSWTGLDLSADNPFGQGGRLRFRGNFSYRDASLDGASESESLLRVDRLSYAIGGRVDERHRFEVGRFLHSEFPEFGVIDGLEYVHRFAGGSRIGASVGLQPTWLDDRQEDGDSQAAVFYRFVTDPAETAALGIGYQKTWHDSQADRDLFVGTVDWRPGDATTIHGSAWVDAYGSDDVVKGDGFELTQAYGSIDQRLGTAAGVSLFGSYIRWPELQQVQFPQPPLTVIERQRVARVGTSGWWRLSDGVTARARVTGWSDVDDSGGDAELGCDLNDVVYDGSQVGLTGFYTQGKWVSELGGRLFWTHWFGRTTLRLGYELSDVQQDDFFGDQETLLQQRLGLVLDAPLSDDVALSLYGERLFGDQQDAVSAGLRLQWRF